MVRMTSYPTLDLKGKIQKSNNIDLFTISSKKSSLIDDIVVVLAVQVDATNEHTRPAAVSPILRGKPSRNPLRCVAILDSARVEQTKLVSGSVE
jgi:hypothetical protein